MEFHVQKNTVSPSEAVTSSAVDAINIIGSMGDHADTVFQLPVMPIVSEEVCMDRILKYQGLQCLVDIEEVIVRRIIRAPQRMLMNEPNKYEVVTTTGQIIFFVAERTEFFVKNSAWLAKPPNIELGFMNAGGENIFKAEIERGFREYMWSLTAKQNNNSVIGRVSQQIGCFTPYYLIEDAISNELMTIRIHDRTEDFCICPTTRQSGCFASNYDILLPSGCHSVGNLQKQCTASGLTNQYNVSFCQGLEPGVKSLLIAAAIMMDLEILPRLMKKRRQFDVKYFCSQFCIALLCFCVPCIILLSVLFTMLNKDQSEEDKQ